MAQLKDLIVTGNSRLINTLYCDNIIGNLAGNATTATTASKLGTNAGSTTTPVYFSGGVPVVCTYSLNKTVPSNAVFTDTTYSAGTGLSLSGTTFNHSNSITAVTTATFYKVKYDAQGHITGSTAVAKSDITALGIPGSDTNTAHTHTNGVGITRTGDGGTSGSVDYKVALASETLDTNASVSRPSTSSTRIYPIIPDKNGKLAVIVPWTDNNTTYSAGTGLSLSGTTFNHSNSVTAITIVGFYKIKHDAQGHITGTTAVAKSDITALGIPGSDTNSYHSTGSWSGLTYTATNNGGAPALAFTLPTGTTSTTVAIGNHTHNYAGSSSAGGIANDSDKLDGLHSSSFMQNLVYSIPGTNDASYNTSDRYSKIATFTFTGAWQEVDTQIEFYDYEAQSYRGTFEFTVRSSSTKSTISVGKFHWSMLTNTNFTQSLILYNTSDGVFELWFKNPKVAYNTTTYRLMYLQDTGGYATFQNGSSWTTTAPTSTIISTSGVITSAINISGNAANTDKLNTNAGSATTPVYFSGGVPVACTYSLNKTVPSNAVFTDTTYSAGTGLSLSGTTFNHSNSVTAITTAGLYKVKYDSQGHITGTTAIAKSDITGLGIPGSDTNTTYTIATGDANGQIKVTPSSGSAYNVSVKGLGSAAYTASTNYATSSHVHISLKSNTDERSTNTTPDNYNGIFKIAGLKSNANIGISGHGTYSGVLGMRGWSDYSGGDAHELALAQDGALMHRHGATTTWSSWNRILTTEWTTAESWTFTLSSGSTVTKNVTLQ